jgi:glucosyl-3-phosphoglycerate phosphatase
VPPRSGLILIRHGESTWNAEQRLQGQENPPLSDRGRAQAARLREALEALPVAGVVSSDLDRARDTAELAGFGDALRDERWREFDLGDWEGLLNAQVADEDLWGWRRGEIAAPGGETWEDFQARVGAAVDELGRRGGLWLVFTHGGCIRAAAAHVTGAPVTAFAGPANCSATLLELDPMRRMLAFNRADEDGLPRPSDPGGTAPPAPA